MRGSGLVVQNRTWRSACNAGLFTGEQQLFGCHTCVCYGSRVDKPLTQCAIFFPAGLHVNYTAPFAQPPVPSSMSHFLPPQATSTPTPSLPTTAAQTFPQNMASISVNNMVSAQQQRPVQQQPQQPQLQSQSQPQQQQQQQQQPQPQTPAQGTPQATAQSGPMAARERARVAVLLDINSMLLQEVVNLQAAGKAGAAPQQQGSQESNSSLGSDQESKAPAQKPSPEYIECMRRLQANLAYLATIADRAKKSGGVPPPAPAIMTPPPNMPSMGEVYNKLKELFPLSGKGGVGSSGGTPQPSPQSIQGNGQPSPSPAAEAAV